MSKDQSHNMRKQKENTAKTLLGMRKQAEYEGYTLVEKYVLMNDGSKHRVWQSNSAIKEDLHR